MIDPTGPLPPGVYWRRRVYAVAVSVAAVVLLAWIIGQLVNGTDPQPVQGASARASQPPSSRSSDEPSSSASVPASSEQPPAPAVAVPAPPPPPQPCPDTAIIVLAETDQPGYRVGQRPLLRLVIANASPAACFRDVSRSLRELVITSADGTKRLWSSNDCYSPPGEDTRLIQPAERLTFTVNWAGRTSAPGCPTRRRTVTAGSYLLTGKLGAIAGSPIPLQLTVN